MFGGKVVTPDDIDYMYTVAKQNSLLFGPTRRGPGGDVITPAIKSDFEEYLKCLSMTDQNVLLSRMHHEVCSGMGSGVIDHGESFTACGWRMRYPNSLAKARSGVGSLSNQLGRAFYALYVAPWMMEHHDLTPDHPDSGFGWFPTCEVQGIAMRRRVTQGGAAPDVLTGWDAHPVPPNDVNLPAPTPDPTPADEPEVGGGRLPRVRGAEFNNSCPPATFESYLGNAYAIQLVECFSEPWDGETEPLRPTLFSDGVYLGPRKLLLPYGDVAIAGGAVVGIHSLIAATGGISGPFGDQGLANRFADTLGCSPPESMLLMSTLCYLMLGQQIHVDLHVLNMKNNGTIMDRDVAKLAALLSDLCACLTTIRAKPVQGEDDKPFIWGLAKYMSEDISALNQPGADILKNVPLFLLASRNASRHTSSSAYYISCAMHNYLNGRGYLPPCSNFDEMACDVAKSATFINSACRALSQINPKKLQEAGLDVNVPMGMAYTGVVQELGFLNAMGEHLELPEGALSVCLNEAIRAAIAILNDRSAKKAAMGAKQQHRYAGVAGPAPKYDRRTRPTPTQGGGR